MTLLSFEVSNFQSIDYMYLPIMRDGYTGTTVLIEPLSITAKDLFHAVFVSKMLISGYNIDCTCLWCKNKVMNYYRPIIFKYIVAFNDSIYEYKIIIEHQTNKKEVLIFKDDKRYDRKVYSYLNKIVVLYPQHPYSCYVKLKKVNNILNNCGLGPIKLQTKSYKEGDLKIVNDSLWLDDEEVIFDHQSFLLSYNEECHGVKRLIDLLPLFFSDHIIFFYHFDEGLHPLLAKFIADICHAHQHILHGTERSLNDNKSLYQSIFFYKDRVIEKNNERLILSL